MTDEPIDPQEYRLGVKVVQIEDLRVARGMARRPQSACPHRNLNYDDKERRIWCKDCETDVDPFDAFKGLVEVWDRGVKVLQRHQRELEESKDQILRSRAAKAVDQVWRSRNRVPVCPHCESGLLSEDVADGLRSTSRQLVEAQRRRDGKPEPKKR